MATSPKYEGSINVGESKTIQSSTLRLYVNTSDESKYLYTWAALNVSFNDGVGYKIGPMYLYLSSTMGTYGSNIIAIIQSVKLNTSALSGFTSNPSGSNRNLTNETLTSWTKIAGSVATTPGLAAASNGNQTVKLQAEIVINLYRDSVSQANKIASTGCTYTYTLTCNDSRRSIAFDLKGGSNGPKSPQTYIYGTYVNASGWTATPPSRDNEDYNYKVSFYNLNSKYASIDTSSATIKKWYELDGFKWSITGSKYGSGYNSGLSLFYNGTMTAQWDPKESGGGQSLKLNSLPSNPQRLGYSFISWNTKSNGSGETVSKGMLISSNINAYAQWTPKTYKISFDLNGGKIPDGYDIKISTYTVEKIYGTTSGAWKTPDFDPVRVGYKFNGWSNKEGTLSKLSKNSQITDIYYDEINTGLTNNNVTLYAQWVLDPNTIKFNYYIRNNNSYTLYTDEESYNITMTQFVKGAPNKDMPGDYVFLGWCDKIPNNWNNPQEENNGYRGVYTLPINAPSSVLPVIVDISKLTTLEDWGRSGNLSEQYYGIWAKTGKYIKINGSFRKVNTVYVKIDGAWKPITDVWTYVNERWKHEI